MQLWDLKSTDLLSTYKWNQNFESDVPCRVFTAQFMRGMPGMVIAGGGENNQIKIFDKHQEDVVNIHSMSRPVFNVDVSQQQEKFVSCGADGVLRVFKCIATH